MPKRTTSVTSMTLSDRLGRPSILSGALVGLMLMASLVAGSFLAWRLAGLPFVAVDVFGWLARRAPGSGLAPGVDGIVNVISSLHLGPTSVETAQTFGKTVAIAGLLVMGAVFGALLFAILRAFRGYRASLSCAFIGTAVGAPLAFIAGSAVQPVTAGSVGGALWILGAFMIWGATLGRSYRRLNSGGATEFANIGRRRFLIRLAGATTAITAAGVVAG